MHVGHTLLLICLNRVAYLACVPDSSVLVDFPFIDYSRDSEM